MLSSVGPTSSLIHMKVNPPALCSTPAACSNKIPESFFDPWEENPGGNYTKGREKEKKKKKAAIPRTERTYLRVSRKAQMTENHGTISLMESPFPFYPFQRPFIPFHFLRTRNFNDALTDIIWITSRFHRIKKFPGDCWLVGFIWRQNDPFSRKSCPIRKRHSAKMLSALRQMMRHDSDSLKYVSGV